LENGIIADPVAFLKEGCPVLNITKMSDAEFGEIVKEITFLPTLESPSVQNAHLEATDTRNSLCSITGNCSYCGEKSEWKNIRLFSSSWVLCSHCSGKLRVGLPPEIMKRIEEGLGLLTQKRKIALWGVANQAVDLLQNSTRITSNENIYFIDTSREKQLMRFSGRKVHSPDVIAEQKVDTIIVMVPYYHAAIKEHARKLSEGIEILSIYDLYNPEFTLTHS